ncbi:MAG: formate-dependent phosphoribosylglycinamide formyltransferase [Alphaproteobacteria bacterium]|nr:formate-dependent phosphoribosylglycinamide formyltransferase [Alphaproteobacteria bacterium]MBO6627411.1 formate-dependent phosphoribosylglycinamide formyltransferase [Alphaproteobacteria bacterium]MDF1626983.1 formate-dependent phosphoribosylglycinamide formyltransferase [Parvibaculaceae bacterium]
MRIGTPLSPSATKVMMLGSGELGKEVVIELQRFGVEVIAVDRYADAPAHQVAHRAYVIDMTDGAALRKLVELERPHLVVPEIEAIATDMLAEIERDSLAEIIPTARATQLTMNREGIRCLAAEDLLLPTSPYAFASSADELRAEIEGRIGFPCFVKPVMSSSGKGQSLVYSADDIDAAWDAALSGGRVEQTRVIVEGKIEFDYEITLLTVRAKGPGGEIETHFCAPIGHLQKNGDYVESWQPQAMSPVALRRAQEVAAKVTDSLGGRGIFGVELFVKGDDVWFSEVSPRPHDTGLVTLATQRLSEFALHARAILGLPVDVALREAGASAVIYGGMEEKAIAFESVDHALEVTGADIRLFGKPESFQKRRMGVAVACGQDVDIARQRAREAAGRVVPVKG